MKKGIFTTLKKSLLTGILITILSPFVTTYTVTNLNQLSDLRFGFPFRFISQQSWLTPFEENLPLRLRIHKTPTKIIFSNLCLSLITTTIIIFIIIGCLDTFKKISHKITNSWKSYLWNRHNLEVKWEIINCFNYSFLILTNEPFATQRFNETISIFTL